VLLELVQVSSHPQQRIPQRRRRAHAEDHHPELRLGYDRCVVRYNTHSVGGISINDFICAAKVDALLA
jgi:pterin-4a-carbinolamine dehydratase